MDDYQALESVTREVVLRDHVFKAKPKMAAPDWGIMSDIYSGTFEGDTFVATSRAIRNSLIPEERPRWDALWAGQADALVPISMEEVFQVANKLLEDSTGRPTQPPSHSGNGGTPTTTPSTAGSGLPEERASETTT